MVDMHNVRTFNADTRFKAGYLNELEKMLEKALPHAMLKAKPNLESKEYRQLVVAEDAVWNSYINSHKEPGQFRHCSFPYYDQLTIIYAKDQATRKDAQTTTDIIEEIDVEEVATNTHKERDDFHGCETNASLDDMDLSATQPQPPRN
ncbi:hypothetical protein Godav_025942 [Gossypium davidsonii]|uniref:Uncharacterized protein n=2 Tax=Gossypium TaxID=3633 RepID=A0A7J8TBX6_GOSDV|nr:hypothetical protein [Gossypium davidsonii]MBA0671437.1 hypothetical protein [Gossypium klotzschianum]